MARVPYSTQVAPETLERVRATVLGMQRQDPTITIAKLTEDALDAWCDQLEREWNDGEAWSPAAEHRPRRGRRMEVDYSPE